MIELCDFSIGYAEKRLLDKVDASFKRGQLMYCTPKVGHFWGVFYEI